MVMRSQAESSPAYPEFCASEPGDNFISYAVVPPWTPPIVPPLPPYDPSQPPPVGPTGKPHPARGGGGATPIPGGGGTWRNGIFIDQYTGGDGLRKATGWYYQNGRWYVSDKWGNKKVADPQPNVTPPGTGTPGNYYPPPRTSDPNAPIGQIEQWAVPAQSHGSTINTAPPTQYYDVRRWVPPTDEPVKPYRGITVDQIAGVPVRGSVATISRGGSSGPSAPVRGGPWRPSIPQPQPFPRPNPFWPPH
jgi:hypothetical protein